MRLALFTVLPVLLGATIVLFDRTAIAVAGVAFWWIVGRAPSRRHAP